MIGKAREIADGEASQGGVPADALWDDSEPCMLAEADMHKLAVGAQAAWKTCQARTTPQVQILELCAPGDGIWQSPQACALTEIKTDQLSAISNAVGNGHLLGVRTKSGASAEVEACQIAAVSNLTRQ